MLETSRHRFRLRVKESPRQDNIAAYYYTSKHTFRLSLKESPRQDSIAAYYYTSKHRLRLRVKTASLNHTTPPAPTVAAVGLHLPCA